MSRKYDLKAIFGDWEKAALTTPSPLPDHLMTDEVLVTDMPEHFSVLAFKFLLAHEFSEQGIAFPQTAILQYTDEAENSLAFQIVFENAVATEKMFSMLDGCIEDMLSHMGKEPSHNGFYIEMIHEHNFDEAQTYIRRNTSPDGP